MPYIRICYVRTKEETFRRSSYQISHFLNWNNFLKVEADFENNGEKMSEKCFFILKIWASIRCSKSSTEELNSSHMSAKFQLQYESWKQWKKSSQLTLCNKYSNSEFFWSVLSRIRSKYGNLQSKSPCSVRMRENADQKKSEYKHFSCSVNLGKVWEDLAKHIVDLNQNW